jgi:leucyl aminopeptidase
MPIFTTDSANAIPLTLISEAKYASFATSLNDANQQWAERYQFTAKPESSLTLPDGLGGISRVLVGVGDSPSLWSLAHLPQQLPQGIYQLDSKPYADKLEDFALGIALAQYQFTRYKACDAKPFLFVLPDEDAIARVTRRADAITLTRDLINMPTNDMGPRELAEAARLIAKRMDAKITVIAGDDLLKKRYPAIHAVGRAAENPPHLIDIAWGNPKHPKVTLVGKGVCFDTGGLDIKPYSSMKLMKKDMGGAALMLGLAQLIAEEKLPVRLRVLIPAVENAISGNAYRPQDILQTRKGLTIEVGSTDAEGRIILADALTEADSESPDLLIDAATLTGAARVALGTELPALFSNDPGAAAELQNLSLSLHDPLWQLPLWDGYMRYLKSPIADVPNSPNYGYAGAITAALFLKRFVTNTKRWMHLDTMAWNVDTQAGRPVGGEALGLRALFAYIQSRYQ